MEPHTLTSPLRVLRVCLHLLMAGLLALAAARTWLDRLPHPAAVTAAVVVMAAVYAVGPLLPRVGRSAGAAGAWLGALGAVWLVLLWLTPDGVWLAFPLFFLQLHLLPLRAGLPVVGVSTVLAIAGYSWHQRAFDAAAVIGPGLGAAVAVATVLGYQALYAENEHRRKLIEELTAARNDLAEAEHAAGVLAERERLAREIHDTLAQGLSSIQLLLRAAERALPEQIDTAGEHVRRARGQAQDNLAEARRFVRALSPPDLDNDSLPDALERLCAETGQQGTPVHFHLDGEQAALPKPHEAALLRIAQSALANVTRHANAGRVDVTLSYMDTSVALDVVDDGVGFDPAALSAAAGDGGFGLAGMRTRVRPLGGSFNVESAPGKGTALSVSFANHEGSQGE